MSLFERPQISLPLKCLRGPSGVGRVVIAHLTHQQRWGIDDHHPHRLAAAIAGSNADQDRIFQAAAGVGEHGCECLAGVGFGRPAGHLHSPRSSRGIHRAAVSQGNDMHHRFLTAGKTADPRGEDQLATADKRGGAAIDLHPLRLVESVIDGCSPRHPPVEPRGLDPHPRRGRDPGPRGDQAGGGHEQTLGR